MWLAGVALYLFFAAALGIYLGTMATGVGLAFFVHSLTLFRKSIAVTK